jgi:pyruvate formate lyase activating enzyme
MNSLPGLIDTSGRIFNFQRYSIHDGPGIRSLLFLKDCPLRCLWCCNPEAFTPNPLYDREITVGLALEWLLEDKDYFLRSGGGLTLAGGEPLVQVDFVKALLETCREHNIGTAMETCGEAPWSDFESIAGLVDYYLYDIKHLDEELHRQYTGVGNHRLLANLKKLSLKGKKIILRLPLIPGYNDSEAEARAISNLMREIDVMEVNILPYHGLGKEKYARLGLAYPFQDRPGLWSDPKGREQLAKFSAIIGKVGLEVYVEGLA